MSDRRIVEQIGRRRLILLSRSGHIQIAFPQAKLKYALQANEKDPRHDRLL